MKSRGSNFQKQKSYLKSKNMQRSENHESHETHEASTFRKTFQKIFKKVVNRKKFFKPTFNFFYRNTF